MRPQQFTNEELIICARKLFIEQGSQISMSVIAQEMGVSQAALFKRFKTKRELIIESLAVREVPAWILQVKDLPDSRSFKKQLSEILNNLATFFKELAPVINIMRIENIDMNELLDKVAVPPPVMAINELTAWLTRCNSVGLIGSVPYGTLAKMILGSVHMNMMLCHLNDVDCMKSLMDDPEVFVEEIALIVSKFSPGEIDE
ncbi:MAG: TetR/AcrR family transcriptional regulator [Fibrobacterales bacterium]